MSSNRILSLEDMNPPEFPDADFNFTLFVVLPSDDVCSLRHLPSGITVHEVQGRLELSAGLPAHVYCLVYPDGERLEDYQRLMVQGNVKDGYIVRVRIYDKWEELYKAVSKNNIQQVMLNGSVQLKGSGVTNSDSADKGEEHIQGRRETALYIASYNGYHSMCSTLLSIGADSNGPTPFGRTALHAAVCRDQLKTLEVLIRHGGSMQQADVYGQTAADTAHIFQSKLCTKQIRVMQLNLRGIAKSNNSAHNQNSKLTIRRDFLNPPSLHSIISGGNVGSRSKTTSVTCPYVSGSRSPQSQCSVETKDTGTASYYTFESMTNLSRQYNVGSASSCVNFLRISVADNSRLGRTISHGPCKSETDVIDTKPLSSDHLYWRFVETTHREGGHRNTSYGHPLEILRNKRTNITQSLHCGTIALESSGGSEAGPEEQIGNQSAMSDENKADGNEHELDKTYNSIDERSEEARNAGILKAYHSLNDPSKIPIRPKTVRFLHKLQTTNMVTKENEPETRKAMHRKINIAAKQSRQETKSRLRKCMHQTYYQPSKDNVSDSGNDLVNNENQGDAVDAFQDWLQKKEEVRRHQNRPKLPVRSLTGIMTAGSTELDDGSPPSPTHDMYAHKDWLEKSRKQRIQNGEKIKTASEFMEAKERLEKKRQKLLLIAISFEEWMENNDDRKSLIQNILQADMENLKKIERDQLTRKAPSEISFKEWQDLLKSRETRVKKRKQSKEEDIKLKLERDSMLFTHINWIKAKQDGKRREKNTPNIETQKNVDEKRDRIEQQYEWLERKHLEEFTELQNMKQNKKPVSRGIRHRKGVPVVVTC